MSEENLWPSPRDIRAAEDARPRSCGDGCMGCELCTDDADDGYGNTEQESRNKDSSPTQSSVQRNDMDAAIRQQRRIYFASNPPNTWLAGMFNQLLTVNGTFEADPEANERRERA